MTCAAPSPPGHDPKNPSGGDFPVNTPPCQGTQGERSGPPPPPPLLTVAEKHVPPRGGAESFFHLSDHHERDRINTPLTSRPECEFDLLNGPGGRFDQPGPLQLESGGVTSHASTGLRTTIPPESQGEIWAGQTIHKNSIAAKLRTAGRTDLAEKLEHCHSQYTFTVCGDCGRTGRFPNRCDCGYCPECQPRLARERREAVEWWTREVQQPKHVVLTAHNVHDLTSGHFTELKLMLSRLRRSVLARKTTYWWISNEPLPLNVEPEERRYQFTRIKAFARSTATHHTAICTPWTGGFWSLEVTNEKRGFHLHYHLLIDARSIHPVILSHFWKLATRGAGHIVKVKDVRDKSYLQEVSKYAVKGSDLAKWTPDQIRTYIEAIQGHRTFGVFGSLYGKRSEFAEWLDQLRAARPLCECGGCNLRYYTEADWIALDLQPYGAVATRPPPPSHQTPEMFPDHLAQECHAKALAR